MKFFSGFTLKREETLFKAYIDNSDYSTCGFSYGAIKALKYVKKEVEQGRRVDRLQLFSPAFFQTKNSKFKELQLRGYRKDVDGYLKQFIDSSFNPHSSRELSRVSSTIEELEELLYFEWSYPELVELSSRGVIIEVYLGGCDNIIDVDSAKEFFLEVATVTFINSANHFLLVD